MKQQDLPMKKIIIILSLIALQNIPLTLQAMNEKITAAQEQEQAVCAACSDEIDTAQESIQLPCAHKIHTKCLDLLRTTSNLQLFYEYEQIGNTALGQNYNTRYSCPLCRLPLDARQAVTSQDVAGLLRMASSSRSADDYRGSQEPELVVRRHPSHRNEAANALIDNPDTNLMVMLPAVMQINKGNEVVLLNRAIVANNLPFVRGLLSQTNFSHQELQRAIVRAKKHHHSEIYLLLSKAAQPNRSNEQEYNYFILKRTLEHLERREEDDESTEWSHKETTSGIAQDQKEIDKWLAKN